MNRDRVITSGEAPLPEGVRAEVIEGFDGAPIRVLHFGGSGERGLALCIPGWAEPAEKYGEVALDLIDRGFTVVSYDPRGQGLSCRFDRDADPRGRIDDYGKHVKDLQAVIDHLKPERLTILAHSMGGLTALSWMAGGGRADAAVLSAPATQIFPTSFQRVGVRALARTLKAIGLGDMALSKEGGQALEFEGNTLTHDRQRHNIFRSLLLTDNDLTVPRTTANMVAALHKQQQDIHSREALANITVPTMIVSLPSDEWVDSGDHDNIVRRSGRLDMSTVEGARHEVLMEEDQYRDQFWDVFDLHTDRYVPRPDPEPEPDAVST